LSIRSVATGATYTWTHADVSNNWSVAANWTKSDATNEVPPLTPPTGEVTALVFTGTYSLNTTSTQNLADAIEVDSITFDSSISFTNNATFALSGSSTNNQFIRLGAGGLTDNIIGTATNLGTVAVTAGANRKIILTADQTWTQNNTFGILSQRRNIEGAFKITKAGNGTVEFQADDSLWTGGLQIDAGVIRTSNFNNALGTGPIVVNTANTVGISASGSSQVDQVVAGPVTLAGTGSFGLLGSWNFTFNNTITLLNDKTFNITHIGTFNAAVGGNFRLTKNGGGTMFLTQLSTVAGFNVTGGSLSVATDAQLGAAGGSIGLGSSVDGGGNPQTGALVARGDLTSGSRDVSILDANGGIIDTSAFTVTVGNVDGAGNLSKFGAGSLNVNHVRANTLTVGNASFAGGTLRVAPNGSNAGVSVVKGLNIVGGTSPTATVDLTDNDLLIDWTGTSPFATVRAQIKNASNGGAWNQPGITTSLGGTMVGGPLPGKTAALGYAEASALGSPSSFGGQSIDDTTVIVKYTVVGDADLDGDADGVDIGTWATNFTGELGGTGSQVWTQGDWDYDGDVDGVDAGLWAQNFTGELGGSGLGSVVVNDPAIAPGAAAILRGMGITVVPEPSALAGVGLLAWMLARRRRSNFRDE
jgi:autotransporter-associated beta strand protein